MPGYERRAPSQGSEIIDALAQLLQDPKAASERAKKANASEAKAKVEAGEAIRRIASAIEAEKKANDIRSRCKVEADKVNEGKANLEAGREALADLVKDHDAANTAAASSVSAREGAVKKREDKVEEREIKAQAREDTVGNREKISDAAKKFADERVKAITEAALTA